MPGTSVNAVVRFLRSLVVAEKADGQSDAGLLDDFTQRREESAFAALLQRHGSMVMGVCARVLAGCVPPQANFPVRDVQLWDVAGGKLLGKLEPTADANILGVSHPCFSPDGKRLACRVWVNKLPPDDQLLQVWNVAEKKVLATWSTPRQVMSLQFVEDGEFLAGSYSRFLAVSGSDACTLLVEISRVLRKP